MASATDAPERELDGDTRARILAAATALIASGGPGAATTRAVAAAASVQAPAIYRLFGDKEGLLDAVADRAFMDYVETKSRRELTDDPLADFRRDWDAHVAFGLAHREVFMLMHINRRSPPSPAWTAGIAIVRESIRRIARDGRLRVNEEVAVDLVDGGVAGTVLSLMRKAPEEREAICTAAREAIFSFIFDLGERPASPGAPSAASALRASLDEIPALSPGERALLDELLHRISAGSSR